MTPVNAIHKHRKEAWEMKKYRMYRYSYACTKPLKSLCVAQQHCNEANLRVFAEMTRNEPATLQKLPCGP